MICREYLENFSLIYLQRKIFFCDSNLFILSVDCYFLIMNQKDYLSTISYFGANLISLYLFSAKRSGNL